MDILSKQKFTNLLIVILVVMNIVSLSYIWYKQLQGPPPPPPQNPGREHVNNFLERELDLTPDQQKQFVEIRKEHAQRTKVMNDRIGRLKKEVMEESFNDKPDINKISGLVDKITEEQKKYEKFLSEHFRRLSEVCTPEQRKILREIFMSSLGPDDRPAPPPGRNPNQGPPPPGHPR